MTLETASDQAHAGSPLLSLMFDEAEVVSTPAPIRLVVDPPAATLVEARAWFAQHGLSSPFHKTAWMDAWMAHVGEATGTRAVHVLGLSADGTPAFHWPLAVERHGPLRIARFMGGTHVNLNFPAWSMAAAGTITAADMTRVLTDLAASPARIDLMLLVNQPERFGGIRNPFALLPTVAAADTSWAGDLMDDPETLLRARMSGATRKKFAKKEKKLAERGAVQYLRAATPADVDLILAAFHDQKATRFAELGIPDVFRCPGVPGFLRAAALDGLDAGTPAIELNALVVGDRIAATYAATVGGGRYSCMFNSLDREGFGRESAGQLLLIHLVEEACRRGLTRFDLGVGDSSYKDTFCDEAEPLFESVLPLTWRGQVAARLISVWRTSRRRIKASPFAWSLVQKWRGWHARKPAAESSAATDD
jgi:CelD/BcsL family acetyltransferase involved in cellulose biosynthesis